MKNIEAVYDSYESVVNYFGKEKIATRIAELLTEVSSFLSTIKVDSSKVKVNDLLLIYVVMDYFTDIMRLKEFHPVSLANKYKIIAYEIFWWLRRKPIQLLDEGTPENAFINEKFAVSLVLGLFDSDLRIDCEDAQEYIDSFYDSLYYYFKYRHFTAQDIEMILLSFKAGSYSQC